MHPFKVIAKNFMSLSCAEIISKLVAIAVVAYLARVLGPYGFGEVSFALAIVSYFMIAANFGLDTLGIRELGRRNGRIEDFVGNMMALKLCLNMLSFLALLLLTLVVNKSVEIKYLLILYGLSLFVYMLFDWVLQGIEQMEYNAISIILRQFVYAAVILSLVRSSRNLLLVPLAYLLSMLAATTFLIIVIFKQFGLVQPKVNFRFWKKLLWQAAPIGLSNFLIALIYSSDIVMLGFIRSSTEVGYYNAAYKIIWLVMGFFVTYFNTIFPRISYLYKASLESLSRALALTSKFLIIITLPLAVGGMTLAVPFLRMIYGRQYLPGVGAFQVLIWVVFLICLNTVYARALWACDRQARYLYVVGIQAGANLILNILFIPTWGILGAAIATVAAELIGIPLYYNEFKKVVVVKVHKYLFRPIIAAGLMGVSLFLGYKILAFSIFTLIPLGIAIYLSALYFMKGITVEDLRSLQAAFSL
jgi:O-antigen/teichoic acid export membrane protein